jgi:hypothetical protein
MSENQDRAPSFVLTKLYRKKSAKGATYFSGRLAGARIVLVKSAFTADDGAEIWNLLASEAPQKEGSGQRTQEQNGRQPQAAQSGARGWQAPLEDEVQFAPEVR